MPPSCLTSYLFSTSSGHILSRCLLHKCRKILIPCTRVPLPTYEPEVNERKKKSSRQYSDTTHSTSIPPHSNTRNNVRSDARTTSTPTTFVQKVAPSSALARAAAGAQRFTSSVGTPWKSMKMRVTTSGAGEMRIWAAFSYDACATKRRATYSCLSKLGNQYLRGPKQLSPGGESGD